MPRLPFQLPATHGLPGDPSPGAPQWELTQAGSIPRWSSFVVIITAALSAAGAIIAAVHPTLLTPPHTAMNSAARVYADYTLSRNAAIAVFLLGLLAVRARRLLGAMVLFVGLIQITDAFVDASTGRLALVPGLLILGVSLGSAAWQLSRSQG